MDRPIRVVTHRNWLADLFVPFGGKQDFGFDINPDEALKTYWWAPGEWVSRALASGVALPLMSCGERWLSIPELREHLGRRVFIGTTDEVAAEAERWGVSDVHVKLPEAKTDRFPAEVVAVADLRTHLSNDLIRSTSLIQISECVDFRIEARFFVSDGEMVAHSWYRNGRCFYDEIGFSRGSDQDDLLMRDLAALVAREVPAPRGFVVDIGVLEDGRAVVIEANAAWSSNPYDSDIAGVVTALKSSHDFEEEHEEWRFKAENVPGHRRPLHLSSG